MEFRFDVEQLMNSFARTSQGTCAILHGDQIKAKGGNAHQQLVQVIDSMGHASAKVSVISLVDNYN